MIPKDPFMLLSYVNTQLRDFYPDLDQMCQALGLEKKELEDKLAGIDYSYNKSVCISCCKNADTEDREDEAYRKPCLLFFYCQAYQ